MRNGPLKIVKDNDLYLVEFQSIDNKNAINSDFVLSLQAALNDYINDASSKLFILKGRDGNFCSGFDIEFIVSGSTDSSFLMHARQSADKFFNLLHNIQKCPKPTMCVVDGEVRGGGIGLAAVFDRVVATSKSRFVCPELSFGLIPAIILPFMVYRLGLQRSFSIALGTSSYDAAEALQMGLIDELVEDIDKTILSYFRKIMRIKSGGYRRLKKYLHAQWPISDNIKSQALDYFVEMVSDIENQNLLKDLISMSSRR